MKKITIISFIFLICFGFSGAVHAELIAYYPFDSNYAQNESSYGSIYDGTVSGATWTSGYIGQSYLFNGSSNYIQAAVNINPSNYPRLTMGAWVYATDTTPIRQIISHDNGGFDRSLGIDSRGGGGWSAFTGSTVLSGIPTSANAWKFVAVVYYQGTSQVMLYVDGVTISTTGTLGTGWDYIRIGSNPSYGEYFKGYIDEVFIYNEALSVSQLDDIRRNGVHPFNAVPEPVTVLLLGLGLVGLAGVRRLKK